MSLTLEAANLRAEAAALGAKSVDKTSGWELARELRRRIRKKMAATLGLA